MTKILHCVVVNNDVIRTFHSNWENRYHYWLPHFLFRLHNFPSVTTRYRISCFGSTISLTTPLQLHYVGRQNFLLFNKKLYIAGIIKILISDIYFMHFPFSRVCVLCWKNACTQRDNRGLPYRRQWLLRQNYPWVRILVKHWPLQPWGTRPMCSDQWRPSVF